MNEKTKLQRHITELRQNIRLWGVTPQQLRYIFKETRELEKMQVPKRAKKLPDYLNASEVWQLLHSCKNPFTEVLIEFLIFTGLRISEARNLVVSDIDFANNQLKVVEGKGKKDRYVPVTTNIASKIKLLLHKRTNGWVFQKNNGKAYSIRALQQRITNQFDVVGFEKKLHTHSLRHTFACLCLAKGMKIQDLQILLGHSSIKTTEIYGRLELGTIKQQFLQLMDQRG
jgi:integrase